MSKHYTPEIEEFHVGFEYEQCMDAKHEKCEMHLLDLGRMNERLGSIRVKHLDQEDIESFGFEFDGEVFISKDHLIYLNKNKVEIYAEDVIFMGIIRNKSELKRVLKQIGYE